MPTPILSLHAHFHQPPRGNPFDDDRVGVEPGAEPHRNWNLKVEAECYKPNAVLGNLEFIGYSVPSALTAWMRSEAPETYGRFVRAHTRSLEAGNAGSALPVPLHHPILPLARPRDRLTQIRWGLAWHRHHFGGEPAGMWLPEMAVDLGSLRALRAEGIGFTVLSQSQVQDAGGLPSAGPYRVDLGEGESFSVYVRDDHLSNMLSFEVSSLGGAGHWARHVLAPRRRSEARMTLVALAGETFGHHHRGEEHFLYWLMRYEASAAGFSTLTLARDFPSAASQGEIRIYEGSSWTCPHGIQRWRSGCPCTPSESSWKGGLRNAFETLAAAVDAAWEDAARLLSTDPWALRDDFIRVVLGERTWPQFRTDHSLSRAKTKPTERARALLWAEYHSQLALTSAAFHADDPDRPEIRTAIANAARAADMAREATGGDWFGPLRLNLERAASAQRGWSGAAVLDELLERIVAGKS